MPIKSGQLRFCNFGSHFMGYVVYVLCWPALAALKFPHSPNTPLHYFCLPLPDCPAREGGFRGSFCDPLHVLILHQYLLHDLILHQYLLHDLILHQYPTLHDLILHLILHLPGHNLFPPLGPNLPTQKNIKALHSTL